MTFPPKKTWHTRSYALLTPTTLGAPNVRLAVRAKALAPSTAQFTNSPHGGKPRSQKMPRKNSRVLIAGTINTLKFPWSCPCDATKHMGKNLGIHIILGWNHHISLKYSYNWSMVFLWIHICPQRKEKNMSSPDAFFLRKNSSEQTLVWNMLKHVEEVPVDQLYMFSWTRRYRKKTSRFHNGKLSDPVCSLGRGIPFW